MMGTRRGNVAFVGLGPGDDQLWTARAAQLLQDADVIVDAEPNAASSLINLAQQGRHVVRTVRGDPLESPLFVAEALEVASAGVAIEIVPGVGASAAAGAFGAIVADAVLTTAAGVADAVALKPRDAPVTLVVHPSLPSQRVLVTTVGQAADVARQTAAARVIVAFGVPQEGLRWFERRPLFGKRVLVTRAREQSKGAASLLRELGAEVVVVPTIEIRDPVDLPSLHRALAELRSGAYGWVAFTSANGVDKTWQALVASGGDARAFGASKLAAIGPATARALEGRGLRADLVASEFVGEALASEMLARMGGHEAKPRVLLARAAKARDVLPDTLRAAGCRVDMVAAYETHPPPRESVQALMHELAEGRVDVATFTSSSTVENFCDLLGPQAATLLEHVRVATIGPVTTDTARRRGIRVDVVASHYTVAGLVEALAESY